MDEAEGSESKLSADILNDLLEELAGTNDVIGRKPGEMGVVTLCPE